MPNTTLPSFSFVSNTKPIIRGQLMGYDLKVDAALVITAVLVTPKSIPQEQIEIAIHPDGNFQMELKYPIAQRQVWLEIGEYYFGELQFSKEIIVNIDLNILRKESTNYYAPKSVNFSGIDGKLTSYVNQYNSYLRPKSDKLSKEIMQTFLDKTISPDDKISTMRCQQEESMSILKQFIKENPSPYTEVLINEHLSDFYGRILGIYSIGKQKMSDSLLEEILAYEPKQLSNAGIDYYRYLCFYLKKNESKENLKTYPEKINRFYTQLQQLQLNEERTSIVIACGGSDDIWKQEQYLQVMLPKIKTPWVYDYLTGELEASKVLIKAINQELAQAKNKEQNLSLGTPHGALKNGTQFYAVEYTEVSDLLNALQKQFPKKAFILDIWATWCSPCISDMRQKMSSINKAKLKEIGVEVIYLCSSNRTDLDTWKRKVTELDMGPSIHIYMNDPLSAKIMTTFKKSGFPSYIFLDKNGQYKPGIVSRISNIDFDKIP